tara:strand:- start:2952 stop:3146 length:195 start_codon:yes stop_codon:yes gene_type:complete
LGTGVTINLFFGPEIQADRLSAARTTGKKRENGVRLNFIPDLCITGEHCSIEEVPHEDVFSLRL